MNSVFLVLAFSAGIMLPIQVGMNANVAKFSDSAIWASAISFLVGTVGMFFIFFLQRIPLPNLEQIKNVPIWAWAAGLLGAYYVTVTIISAPKIGTTMLISLVVAGQMIAALAIDHYGLLGFQTSAINLMRILGVLMVLIGVVLVRAN